MATIKVLPSGAFQIRVVSKLLPKPFYASFDTRDQAIAFSDYLTALLAQGIVPEALVAKPGEQRTEWHVHRCIAEYIRAEPVKVSEVKLLDTIRAHVPNVRTSEMNFDWAETWIRHMKRSDNLAPSTIRHRHGALARCLDWVCRRHPQVLQANPLRLLRRGFATYTFEDAKHAAANGGKLKHDVERDRRLEDGEEERLLACLADLPEARMLFVLALETAMRMRECYTLGLDQVSLKKKSIHLDRSKNGDGREVPLSSTIAKLLAAYIDSHAHDIADRDGRLFSYWNGDLSEPVLDATTVRVSLMFSGLFEQAKMEDFRFHDLRHEATCRLYEKTTLSDILIARITGHRDLRMLRRYASLRGSDLAARLW